MNQLSFIPLGGIGDVTKNMYLYEYSPRGEAGNNQILIVDCGLGFADETMLGVDLLLPDISYLLNSAKQNKKIIVGMVLTHGHEDHMGALPFILPQLPKFPIFATPLTAELANAKLREFGEMPQVNSIKFGENERRLGVFSVSFIRVTHSVPDTSHLVIKTPLGIFYHGSDFKFDDTPYDGKKTEYEKIEKAGKEGVFCLLSDSLGAERKGRTPSEISLTDSFSKELAKCQGKFIVTTYSSNISRLNQIIKASSKFGRKICFVGRSLINTKEVAKRLGYLNLPNHMEVPLESLRHYKDKSLTLIVAGSQGQENSALSRIVNDEHRDVRLLEKDTIIFSADAIPGNETLIYQLIDSIAKKGARVLHSDVSSDFHVSGHGSSEDLKQLISMVKPKKLIPIGGAFRHMSSYRGLAKSLGYRSADVSLLEDGQELIFSENDGVRMGRTIAVKNVYVDQISGEEIEGFILRDRKKLSEGGVIVVLLEIDSGTGQIVGKPDLIVKGFTPLFDTKGLNAGLLMDLKKVLGKKHGRVMNWIYTRRLVGEIAERRIFKDLRRRPLVLPVVIEV